MIAKMFYNFSPFKADFFKDLESHQIKIITLLLETLFGSQVAVLDVSARFVNEISILVGNKYSKIMEEKQMKQSVSFVSGGYPGNAGDLVVDCYLAPF